MYIEQYLFASGTNHQNPIFANSVNESTETKYNSIETNVLRIRRYI